jgi:hypothetical protein
LDVRPTTTILNEMLQVLQKEEDLQAHLNDKTSDNAPDNTSSNVNSLDDNNSNDIPVPCECLRSNVLHNSMCHNSNSCKNK